MSTTWAGKTPTRDEWRDILEKHARWLSDVGGERADLQCAYLRGADLQCAYLRDAYLQGANLQGAYLRGANLQDVDLRGAYLQGANLRGAYLRGANLRGADLQCAYLRDAYLQGANLQGANLQCANLQGADLQGAYLQGAKGELPIYRFQIVPESGSFMAWKKLRAGVIAELLIPATAGRVGGLIGRKCRAERAVVVSLSDGATEGHSLYRDDFVYRPGETVEPFGGWDPSPLVECAAGIHFYISRREAEEHE